MNLLRVRPIESADGESVRTTAVEAGLDLDLEAEGKKPWAMLWVAEFQPGKPVAYVLCWKVADELELVQVATRPSERRRGAARELLLALLAWARSNGISGTFLEVRRSNEAALRLYQSVGFAPSRVRTHYYSDGEDAVEMRHSPS